MTRRDVGGVTVFGSINMDTVLRVQSFPHPGETVVASQTTQHAGGKGLNQAIAAARAGAAVRMMGCVGDDADGKALRSVLEAEGIDCAGVGRRQDHATGTAYVAVDSAGENQIIVSSGANATVRAGPVSADGILLAQLELPLPEVATFLSGRGPHSLAILNAAPFHPDARKLLALAGYCNRVAPPDSRSRIAEMARELLDREGQTIIITLGKAGSIAVSVEGELVSAARAVEVVDTTGAGDCFCGFLASDVARGEAIDVAIAHAHEAASIAVGRWGAASSLSFVAEMPSSH